MKQQDIAIIIVIVFVASVSSFLISNKFISPGDKTEKAEVVTKINSQFDTAGAKNINPDAINPTVRIEIGDNENAQPFTNGDR